MSFGFDPSIILANTPKAPAESSLNDTLQTLSQLQTGRTQNQVHQAQLADLLRQQQQQAQLSDIYRGSADKPADLPTALMRAGFGPQAYQAQDQASQMQTADTTRQKMVLEIQDAQRKKVGELFYGTKDAADYQARLKQLAADPDPMMSVYASHLPTEFDPGVTERLGNLAMSAKDRAELADKKASQAETGRHNLATEAKLGETERHDRAMEGRLAAGMGMGGGLPNGITQGALEKQVDTYERTGTLPQLGQGKAGAALRVAIMNRHAEKYPDSDIAGAKAGYQADSNSLKSQQKLSDAMNAFEKTAGKNLDVFTNLAKGLADTGSPLFNAPAREFKERVAGDPKMAGINTARTTALTEISKVLSGALGNGAVSDSARHEVEGLIKGDATLAQIMEAARVLKLDMANRKEAVESQLKETRGRISGKGAKEGGESKKIVKYLVSPDKTRRVAIYADGSEGPEEAVK